tara:strand:- start:328 stop:501 length:174 start_codon:yes stop_codon:yes gene_type:complete
VKKLFIIIILITGCSYNDDKVDNNNLDINYSDDLPLKEFQIKLKAYAQNSPYPNIDE